MKKIFLLLMAIGFGLGCSEASWLAEIYMFQAEGLYAKAHALRVKKIRYEDRLKYYREACDDFSKAYQSNPKVFTLNRINLAAESCMRVGDSEKEEKFKEFEEAYIKEHPKEVEYGDAGFMIGLE